MTDKFKPKIMFVDDEPEVLMALKRIFRRDYETFTFDDPAQAIEFLNTTRVHLVISDMRMPNITGAKVLAATKQIQPKAKRILLSGYSDMDSTIEAINQGGIHAYITKPWDNDRIKEVVEDSVQAVILEAKNEQLSKQLIQKNKALEELNQTLDKKVQEQTQSLRLSLQRLSTAAGKQRKLLHQIIEMISLIAAEQRGSHYSDDVRIAKQCRLLGHKLKLEKSQLTYLYLAASLHELGKIALPEELLTKPESKMSAEELLILHKQANKGADIIDIIPSLHEVSDILRYQYERYAGKGFPDLKQGEDIPIGSRILAVVRDYDKYISGYFTGKKLSPRDALQALKAQSNRIYDKKIIEAFTALLKDIPSGSDAQFCLTTDMLKPGMIIAQDVKYANGNIVLTQGTTLTDAIIGRLEQYEIKHDFAFLVFTLIPQQVDTAVD
ncbi:hypothetical protein PULV_a2241 [Pseudoalteromonas ulvae UL12]|uniref:Two-component system response regulator n=1 Tax=Pseudoalteromonas ulvae TaxID=107327 RepID=A0A2C9ZZX1_PSEDV|nr:HD domain-containing phosphohydrolase [Pseudoalteromonas ulvae]MBE0364531.1 hypothetical protein [Pseudoalteromonas ulvae UL12]OUL56306.1 hypothetical protein B1199_19555 [Pseudoalteromonas ulvae]